MVGYGAAEIERDRGLSAAIATCLGGKLVAEQWAENGYFHISDGSGREISLHFFEEKGINKVNVTGAWPKERLASGQSSVVGPRDIGAFHGKAIPGIYCSTGRGVEKVAADITRRFLPEYAPMYDKIIEVVRARESSGEIAKEAAHRLAAVGKPGSNPRGPEANGQEYRLWVEHHPLRVAAYDGKVSVRFDRNLDGLSEDQATRILAILAENKE